MMDILVLGIHEDDYYVYISAYIKACNKYTLIRRSKQEFMGERGRIWNTFAYVKCGLQIYNLFSTIRSGPISAGQSSIKEVKRMLRTIDGSLEKFLNPYNKEKMIMFSADKIGNFIKDTNKILVEFESRGNRHRYELRDSRLLKYLLSTGGSFEKNKSKAIECINKEGNVIYMVVYRGQRNHFPYISVIHSL